MSRYGDWEYDEAFDALIEFLKGHKPSELLRLVVDAVELWEEEKNE